MKRSEVFHGISVVIAGFLVHLSFGCMYTIGNMAPYIASYIISNVDREFNKGSVVWLSAAALASQGLFMPLGGLLAPKLGVRLVVIIGSVINSGIYMLTYFAIQKGFVYVLVTHICALGLGLGFSYSVVMQTAASWFPDHSGLIVGLIAAGFGLGAFVFTPIQLSYVNPNNIPVDNKTRLFVDKQVLGRIPMSYIVIGGVMCGLQLIGCLILRKKPSKKEMDKERTSMTLGLEKKSSVEVEKTSDLLYDSENPDAYANIGVMELGPKKVLRSRYFYLLWLLMLCNIIPITLLTSAYKLVGQEHITDDVFLSTIATLSSLFNSLGRIFWGFLVDRLSFKIPICTMLFLWAATLFAFPNVFYWKAATIYLYGIAVCLMFFSMSGVFGIMPAATRILFGHENMATNYGMVFSAFSVGSILSALASQYAKGAWTQLFYASGGVCILAFLVVIWIFDPQMPRRCRPCCFCARTDHRR
nr:unnamed protein product [Spirometra erinaceieuropaei]